MREIEFRGKRIDNGEWVYGYLFKIWERTYILWGTTNDIPNMIEVDPSTIGQFTGLYDKNGIKIYEGDIIELEDRYVIVEWNKYLATYDLGFLRYKNRIDNGFIFKGVKMLELFRYKIIGNMYDKEEL